MVNIAVQILVDVGLLTESSDVKTIRHVPSCRTEQFTNFLVDFKLSLSL